MTNLALIQLENELARYGKRIETYLEPIVEFGAKDSTRNRIRYLLSCLRTQPGAREEVDRLLNELEP